MHSISTTAYTEYATEPLVGHFKKLGLKGKAMTELVGDRSRDADLAEIKEWEDRLDELDRQRADAIW